MEQNNLYKVWVDDKMVWVETKDGVQASTPINRWARLASASPSEREDFYLSPCGIHWPKVDEDLSFEGIFADAGLCGRRG